MTDVVIERFRSLDPSRPTQQPPFDLGTWRTDGNPHTRGLELARDAVVAQDDRYARLHTTILPSARQALDEAERHCGLLSRGDANERAEWDLLHSSLFETRTKEKLVLGDLESAMDHASRLVEHTPADPHPRLELGEVQIAVGDHGAAIESYRWAALLGPHVIQVPWPTGPTTVSPRCAPWTTGPPTGCTATNATKAASAAIPYLRRRRNRHDVRRSTTVPRQSRVRV